MPPKKAVIKKAVKKGKPENKQQSQTTSEKKSNLLTKDSVVTRPAMISKVFDINNFDYKKL